MVRGEDIELVARSIDATAADVSGWRDVFLFSTSGSYESLTITEEGQTEAPVQSAEQPAPAAEPEVMDSAAQPASAAPAE